MKEIRINVKNLFVAVLMGIGIASCTSDEMPESSTNSTNTINNDLFTLANKCERYYIDAKYSTLTRSGGKSQELNKVLDKMDEELAEFCKIHDVFADLTESQKRNLAISEDSLEIMRIDPDVYLEYAKSHKSEAFYEILYQIFKKGKTNYNSNDIINNSELYLNEKLNLILALPMLESTVAVAQTRAATTKSYSRENTAKEQACIEEYKDAKLSCMLRYFFDLGLAIGPDIVTMGGATAWTVIGFGVAVYDYTACEDQAHEDYKLCMSYAHNTITMIRH